MKLRSRDALITFAWSSLVPRYAFSLSLPPPIAQLPKDIPTIWGHWPDLPAHPNPDLPRNAKAWYAGSEDGAQGLLDVLLTNVLASVGQVQKVGDLFFRSTPSLLRVARTAKHSDIDKTMAVGDPEKYDSQDSERQKDDSLSPPPSDRLEYDHHSEKALIRKVDWRLLPILGALYSIALIDRVNISAARVAGMDEALGLDIGHRYTVALVVFFIPYFLLELPSNIVLRKVGSANWLAGIAFAWGTVMLGQGFVKNYHALAGCRALLGMFEAGFFPGCVYLITCWYVRYETQKRLAAFYLISAAVGGFSSILAYGLMQMDGLSGVAGWQWIFIIEGLLTQVVAIIAWFIIIDFPDRAAKKGFLDKNDAQFMEQRIEDDRKDAVADPLTWAKFFHHLADFKLWCFALMFMSTTMPAYALAYFAPVIILGMGYSTGVTQLLSAPPVVFAVISALTIAWLSDKYRVRGPAIAFQSVVGIVGLMITAYHSNDGVRYFGLFLGQAGCQGNIPAILTYQSNNIRMQSKRAVGSALQIGFGAIGGIIASTVFQEKDAPQYVPGLWVTTGLQFFILLLLACLTVFFFTMNKKVDNGTIKGPIEESPGFKYTL